MTAENEPAIVVKSVEPIDVWRRQADGEAARRARHDRMRP
jgi:hypothetical protein